MKAYHKIRDIRFEDDVLFLVIDGIEHRFYVPDISTRLKNASILERQKYEISPSGYGIHWPLIDEDLSIDGLLGIKHAPIAKKEAANI